MERFGDLTGRTFSWSDTRPWLQKERRLCKQLLTQCASNALGKSDFILYHGIISRSLLEIPKVATRDLEYVCSFSDLSPSCVQLMLKLTCG